MNRNTIDIAYYKSSRNTYCGIKVYLVLIRSEKLVAVKYIYCISKVIRDFAVGSKFRKNKIFLTITCYDYSIGSCNYFVRF